jgi:hypothetical protein
MSRILVYAVPQSHVFPGNPQSSTTIASDTTIVPRAYPVRQFILFVTRPVGTVANTEPLDVILVVDRHEGMKFSERFVMHL